MNGSGPLAGRRVLVTRPRDQSAALAGLIAQAGGEAVLFPAIEIADAADPAPARALLARLEDFDFAVFVSANAVERGLALLGRPWPARVRAAAVGAGTRRLLEERGVREVIAPGGQADSEALLALPPFATAAAVGGRRVVIIRGEGGRELLREVLQARGALVEYAECYRRLRPQADGAALLADWGRRGMHAVTAYSAEALANLQAMLGEGGGAALRTAPLFVPHPRVAEAAARLGMRRVFVAGPGDGEMLQQLVAYFAQGN